MSLPIEVGFRERFDAKVAELLISVRRRKPIDAVTRSNPDCSAIVISVAQDGCIFRNEGGEDQIESFSV